MNNQKQIGLGTIRYYMDYASERVFISVDSSVHWPNLTAPYLAEVIGAQDMDRAPSGYLYNCPSNTLDILVVPTSGFVTYNLNQWIERYPHTGHPMSSTRMKYSYPVKLSVGLYLTCGNVHIEAGAPRTNTYAGRTYYRARMTFSSRSYSGFWHGSGKDRGDPDIYGGRSNFLHFDGHVSTMDAFTYEDNGYGTTHPLYGIF